MSEKTFRCTYEYIPYQRGWRTPAGDRRTLNYLGYSRKKSVPAGEVIALLNGKRSDDQQRRVDRAAQGGRHTQAVFAAMVDKAYGKGYSNHVMHEEAARRGIILLPILPD